jgi:hypothetical protein
MNGTNGGKKVKAFYIGEVFALYTTNCLPTIRVAEGEQCFSHI